MHPLRVSVTAPCLWISMGRISVAVCKREQLHPMHVISVMRLISKEALSWFGLACTCIRLPQQLRGILNLGIEIVHSNQPTVPVF
jgi:hypothetical protein